MKIQQLPFRPASKLPPKPAQPPVPQDSVEPSRWQKIGKTMLKGATGAAVGVIPAAAAGYAISSWGGVPGAILGGCVGVAVGYFSGKEVREVAQKMAAKDPAKLNFFHKAALKIGPAAPYVWAAVAGAECALAGATFMPAISALTFGKKGLIAGALFMGTKH
ncbi:MAG: hypothetical protein J0I12_21235 [Candidatus Eremiobacteraeota bacterium]|nr:hypothetical protein [Candidatus Eremiobacteraeota bacterium]